MSFEASHARMSRLGRYLFPVRLDQGLLESQVVRQRPVDSAMAGVLGIPATPVRELGLRNARDRDIFFEARTADAVVITKDADFISLLRQLGPPPRVIWLRCGNTSNAASATCCARHYRKHWLSSTPVNRSSRSLTVSDTDTTRRGMRRGGATIPVIPTLFAALKVGSASLQHPFPPDRSELITPICHPDRSEERAKWRDLGRSGSRTSASRAKQPCSAPPSSPPAPGR